MHFRTLRRPLALCAVAVALVWAPAAARAQALDSLVLADVNGDTITRANLVSRLLDYRGEDARDKMVNRRILLQEAKRLNVSVTDDEVAKKMAELQGRFKNEGDYRGFLARSRVTEEQLRDETRHTLLVQKVAVKESPITDKDLEQYEARMAVAPDKATAEKWIKELDAGADFAVIAGRSEDASLRQAKGRLRPFLRIEMLDVSKAIDEQMLAKGGFTKKPVQLGNNAWVVIKLENRITVGPTSKVSVSEQERLQAAVTAYRVDQWLTQARAKAKVETKPITEAVVAVVNGEPITRDQLVVRLLQFQGEEALEQMVNRALLLKAARQHNLAITEEEADKKLAEVRSKFKTPEEYEAFLTRANVNEKQLRDELRYTALMQKVALKDAPVTDDDLIQYDVRMLIAPDKTTAESWAKELETGGDFAKMAEQRSADEPGRTSGGRMRPFLKVEFLDVWRALEEQKVKPGGHTKKPVLLTDSSWALLKLENRVAPTALKPEERERRVNLVTNYRVGQWLAQSRATAKISYPVPLSPAVIQGGAAK